MAKVYPISTHKPQGSDSPRLGDDVIRALARAVVEWLGKDHFIESDFGGVPSGKDYDDDDGGKHIQITFREAMDGTPSLGDNDQGILYIKDLQGVPELMFRDAAGNEIQLTDNGVIKKTSIQDNAFIPTGAVFPFVNAVAPDGFLLCQGQEVSRTEYADLFSVIGTTYGAGDGITTFNVPDGRGRTFIGAGQGETYADGVIPIGTNFALGEYGGKEQHKLTVDQIPSHTHGLPNQRQGGGFLNTDRAYDPANQPLETPSGETGGDEPHNNMMPYLTGNWIIKT